MLSKCWVVNAFCMCGLYIHFNIQSSVKHDNKPYGNNRFRTQPILTYIKFTIKKDSSHYKLNFDLIKKNKIYQYSYRTRNLKILSEAINVSHFEMLFLAVLTGCVLAQVKI